MSNSLFERSTRTAVVASLRCPPSARSAASRASLRPRTIVARRSGFSLVELMIVMAVFALLFALGLPSIHTFMRNSQIRNAAEAISNGLQVARGQAIHRNVLVQFVLTPGTPASWTVDSIVNNQPVNVQSWSAQEGSAETNVVTNDGNTTVTFNGLGRMVTPNPDGSPVLTQIDVGSSQAAGTEIKPMRVVISPSGSVRMCDPNPLPAGDPRAC